MRHAVELNHVPVGSTCARRCLVDLHPVTPLGVALYRSARGAPLAVRSRIARIEVRSLPAVRCWWWRALRCAPAASFASVTRLRQLTLS